MSNDFFFDYINLILDLLNKIFIFFNKLLMSDIISDLNNMELYELADSFKTIFNTTQNLGLMSITHEEILIPSWCDLFQIVKEEFLHKILLQILHQHTHVNCGLYNISLTYRFGHGLIQFDKNFMDAFYYYICKYLSEPVSYKYNIMKIILLIICGFDKKLANNTLSLIGSIVHYHIKHESRLQNEFKSININRTRENKISDLVINNEYYNDYSTIIPIMLDMANIRKKSTSE